LPDRRRARPAVAISGNDEAGSYSILATEGRLRELAGEPDLDLAVCNQRPRIETGDMRNAGDAALLGSPSFRQREAEALAAALQHFLEGRR